MKNLLLAIAFVATTFSYGQDALSWSPAAADFPQAPSVTFQFAYTADAEVPIGGIKLDFWAVSAPWTQGWKAWGHNTAALPAGTGTVDITINIEPGSNVLNGNGDIMTKAELLVADPNGQGAPTNYYYEIRVSTPKAEFNPPAVAKGFVSAIAGLAGLDDNALNDLKVYPNPTSGVVNISDVDGIDSVTISNINGQVLKTFSGQNSIDISDLVPGVYVLQADNGLIRKIIKK